MSGNGQAYARLADFSTERFCPYHGGRVKLASCPVVATNEDYLNRDDDGQVALQRDVGDKLANDVDYEAPPVATEARAANGSRVVRVADIEHRLVTGAELFPRGSILESNIDKRQRLVVHPPPQPKQPASRGLFRKRTESLPLPAELAVEDGGPLARPARACPRCLHPFPAEIDNHDPMLVPLVGHTQASKTTTVAAFVDELSRVGPGQFGVPYVAPTERTSQALTGIMRQYRSRADVQLTQRDRWIHPLEFIAEPRPPSRPSIVYLHDVAGENVMHRNQRMVQAPFVLWADAILFVYNPEASPRMRPASVGADWGASYATREGISGQDAEQSAVLNGLYDDLKVSPRTDLGGKRSSGFPPLVIAVSKADLLPDPPDLASGPLPEEMVQQSILDLDDAAFVAAGERWPEIHWRFIAPKPAEGGPQGIVDLFDLLLSLVTR
jgi:hypothetical protein